LHCVMKNLFKKQSAKFVQIPLTLTKIMAKHILVCFLCPTVYITDRKNDTDVLINTNLFRCWFIPVLGFFALFLLSVKHIAVSPCRSL